MREIKYRVWLNRTKEFFYSDSIEYQKVNEIETLTTFFNHLKLLINTDEKLSSLQQYTGFKDKNNKDIYEGDIILWEDIVEVYWDYRLLVNIRDYTLGVEVIGNIYENPELLEVNNSNDK
jgi:uncharacterized phage protein (TIGR01671 family)